MKHINLSCAEYAQKMANIISLSSAEFAHRVVKGNE